MRIGSQIPSLLLLVAALFCAETSSLAQTDGSSESAAKLSVEETKFFESKIRPVLIRECYSCHSTKSQVKGGLWLDTKQGTIDGGDSGPAVVPGDLDESLIWDAINHDGFRMPPGKKLPDDVIADFKTWIEMGAPDPRVRQKTKVNSSISQADIEAGKEFWAFKAPEPTTVPSDTFEWAITDIDRFVSQQLGQNNLTPAPDASAATFLRRLSFALIGLPPSPRQVEWLEARWDGDREEAVSHIVDSLLAKPEFGERWGRHWLDVARYSESTGKELNTTYPQAWRYRDYVIDSFNEDKPYDRFIQEQIAGDLLPVKTDEQWAENLVATTFLAMGPKTLTEQNSLQFELDLVDEQVDVTTRVVMGVSVACARCHDHKFDPIPQTDYYALAGIFHNSTTHYGTLDTFQNRRPSNLLMLPVDDPNNPKKKLSKTQLAELNGKLGVAERELRRVQLERRNLRNGNGNSNSAQMSILEFARYGNEVASLKSVLNNYDKNGNPIAYTMGMQEKDRVKDVRLLERGEFDKPAQTVKRGFPQVMTDNAPSIKSSSSGRLELARWMGSEDNPLTARVMVNRVWQHMFGDGLVRSPENFGATGLRPTHPELLDHLAVEFMNEGWSIKSLIKKIAISRAYRVSSDFDQRAFEKDPENKFVWRYSPRRLDAEAIRDSLLKISGNLQSERPYGSLVTKLGDGVVRDGFVVSTSEEGRAPMGRVMRRGSEGPGSAMGNSLAVQVVPIEQPSSYRSIYLPVIRDGVYRAMSVFDFAEPSMVVGSRERSNTPDQGLFFLNNSFVIEQSDDLAKRIIAETSDRREQVEKVFALAYSRKATPGELRAAKSFFEDFELSRRSTSTRNRFERFRSRQAASTADGASTELEAFSAFCQAVFASAEFRYIN